MDCPTCETMVDAYVDGELTASEAAAFEEALPLCPGCRARLERVRTLSDLVRGLPARRAPDLLRARVEREVRSLARRPAERLRYAAVAAGLVLALGIGWLGGSLVGAGSRENDELLAGYLRVAMSDHAVQVASSDRHTVKPWFAGRIDYSPPVFDLTAQGFPLLGGRVDLIDRRRVAVLVYQRNQHRVALMLWPAAAAGDATPAISERDGFAMAHWRRGGFELHAVADIAPAEMRSFAASIDKAFDAVR